MNRLGRVRAGFPGARHCVRQRAESTLGMRIRPPLKTRQDIFEQVPRGVQRVTMDGAEDEMTGASGDVGGNSLPHVVG